MMIFGFHASLPMNICKVFFKVFSPLMWEILHAWRDVFTLMWEILHAWRETGRNSVQAEDSLSMRESWKPCVGSHI